MFLPFTLTGNVIGKATEKNGVKMMALYQLFLHNTHLIKNIQMLQIKSKGHLASNKQDTIGTTLTLSDKIALIQ